MDMGRSSRAVIFHLVSGAMGKLHLTVFSFWVGIFLFGSVANSANGQSGTWERLPGNAKTVGAGADGSVYAISPGDQVYQWNDSAFGWMGTGGEARRVDVDPDGVPWAVTGQGDVYRLRGETWRRMPGKAEDVGIGADGSVYVVGNSGEVYSWNESSFSWSSQGGDAERITVADGTPWVATNSRKIYRLRGGGNWQNIPGRARDLAAGPDGTIWAAGEGGKVYMWNEDAFQWQDMGGDKVREIDVDGNGFVWVVTLDDRVYRTQGPVDENGIDDESVEDGGMGMDDDEDVGMGGMGGGSEEGSE